ncbi:MAG TPA: dihydroorotate dehydrogenase electron transfer subunit [Prevotella sp.]|nr:dihydroorotate dehydrogenase electron transfer subunit [Prevotella sp.]
MKKYILDLQVVSVEALSDKSVLLRLTDSKPLPEILPGQFVEVRVDHSPSTFLRRPISVNFVDNETNQLWLLVAMVGEGTRQLGKLHKGDTLNCIFPLGNSFSMPVHKEEKILLVGGGVGVAPLLYFGKCIYDFGAKPVFLLGARSSADLLELDLFKKYGRVYVTTEDGSNGEKGFVTDHSLLGKETFDQISVCGPKPMMVSVARYAVKAGIECEVSLENNMACGIGACLCCVENTTEGNLKVCQDGPVFNIKKLLWQI